MSGDLNAQAPAEALGGESVDGLTHLPGDVLADLVAQRGSFVAIYGWSSNQPGKGGTRTALRALKEYAETIVVHDPGEKGSASYAYWSKMLVEGLVTQVLGADDVDLTAAMSAGAAAKTPPLRAPRPR